MNGDLIPIEKVIHELRQGIDWPHSFIRECYFASSRCKVEIEGKSRQKEIGDTFGPQYARLVVAVAGNPNNYGIEFLFTKVKVFSIGEFKELGFRHNFDKDSGHLVDFSNTNTCGKCWITAEKVDIRFLGKSYIGPDFELGFEIPNEEFFEAIPVQKGWRQCRNCQNIWQMAEEVKKSRCPNCHYFTKMGEK